MPELKEVITYLISIVSIIVTGIFSYLVWRTTQKSNQLIRMYSSEKPFIRPIGYINNSEDMKLPIIRVENCGPGHAVNVEVEGYVAEILTGEEIKKYFTKYDGPNILPYLPADKITQEEYKCKLTGFIGQADEKLIRITYESDSGYKMRITWKMENSKFKIISRENVT